MRIGRILALLLWGVTAAYCQTDSTTVAPEPQADKTALAAQRAGSKLDEAALHKSVLSYALADEIVSIMPKCLAGEPEACYFSLKIFENSADKSLAAQANTEMAILALQRGLVKQALGHIARAAELSPDDPFIALTHGWMLLSAGKYKKARQVFAQLLYLTADFEYVSSSKLGTALSFYLSGKKEEAVSALQYLYTSNPYTISLVSYLLGDVAYRTKKTRHLAPVFLQQSLTHDEKNYAAAKRLAQIAEKENKPLQAWQYYATLFSLDSHDETLADKVEKYTPQTVSPTDYLFYLRLDQPIVHEMTSTPSPRVRMALYADPAQVPQLLQEASVVGAGSLKVREEKMGEVLRVPSYVEKTLAYNAQTGGVDLKNAKGQVEFSARRPFTFVLDQERRTLLVHKLRAENIFAADLSDKELKGSLTVIPEKDGFWLINDVYAEDLIPALLAARVHDVTQPETLKALSVVFRSALENAVQTDNGRPYHITDNDEQFTFKGINLIFNTLLEAAKDTQQVRLARTQAGLYDSCGTVAARHIQNSNTVLPYVFSPANVSKYMLSNPPADLFSKPQDPTRWSQVKWMYLYDGKDIEKRIAYRKNIGRLRALVPLTQTPNGRILSMRFEGSKGEYVATNPQEIAFLLSAGTLRSNFFDIVPLYKGKNIRQILVRGYDSGLGEGLCVQGAEGLAKNGADSTAIIKYYFPEARLVNTLTGQVH